MTCSSCGKNKADLHPRKSKLMTGMTLYLCSTCSEKRMEPRYVVVLYGRANGFDSISGYIKLRRYAGNEITASELV